ncbi:hypothetical protein QFC20_007589 [Naganishia adeliensis]|uniref:Uncharacterized protein n=1 Tax=Naganishia adeliensis TaxID=92952 RepID=A0ACC2UXZ8_9TREE|nr:hypothetical protein QFC20_007589 [Naganishia adeliensis]
MTLSWSSHIISVIASVFSKATPSTCDWVIRWVEVKVTSAPQWGEGNLVGGEPLGQGSYGKVVIVHQKDDSSKVYACKYFRNPIKRKYCNELTVLKRMNEMDHRNIIRLEASIHYGWDPSTVIALVFPRIERTLGQCISARRFGQLQPKVFAALVRQMLDGVQAIHSAGILHLDLKPDNVMIDADGTVKPIDFGISLSEEMVSRDDWQLVELVTSFYQAPELFFGNKPNRQADIFGAGVSLQSFLARVPILPGNPAGGQPEKAHRPVAIDFETQLASLQNIEQDLTTDFVNGRWEAASDMALNMCQNPRLEVFFKAVDKALPPGIWHRYCIEACDRWLKTARQANHIREFVEHLPKKPRDIKDFPRAVCNLPAHAKRRAFSRVVQECASVLVGHSDEWERLDSSDALLFCLQVAFWWSSFRMKTTLDHQPRVANFAARVPVFAATAQPGEELAALFHAWQTLELMCMDQNASECVAQARTGLTELWKQQEVRSTDRDDGRITATLRPATTRKEAPLPVPEEAMPLRDMAAVGGQVERANEHVDMPPDTHATALTWAESLADRPHASLASALKDALTTLPFHSRPRELFKMPANFVDPLPADFTMEKMLGCLGDLRGLVLDSDRLVDNRSVDRLRNSERRVLQEALRRFWTSSVKDPSILAVLQLAETRRYVVIQLNKRGKGTLCWADGLEKGEPIWLPAQQQLWRGFLDQEFAATVKIDVPRQDGDTSCGSLAVEMVRVQVRLVFGKKGKFHRYRSQVAVRIDLFISTMERKWAEPIRLNMTEAVETNTLYNGGAILRIRSDLLPTTTASGGSAYEPQLWFNHLKSCKFISEPDAEQLVDRDVETDNSKRRTEDCQMARAITKENGDPIASK